MREMSAWTELGLPLRLVLDPTEVESHFRERSATVHPDAGGSKGDFERLREARDLLTDRGRRLELWLRENGVELAHSGAISESVGVMFGRVGEVTAGVDAWSDEGKAVTSGLGKALWQKRGFTWKREVEELIVEIESWQNRLGEHFPEIEQQGAEGDFVRALEVRGELGFLRKWRRDLQARFGKIWEGLV